MKSFTLALLLLALFSIAAAQAPTSKGRDSHAFSPLPRRDNRSPRRAAFSLSSGPGAAAPVDEVCSAITVRTLNGSCTSLVDSSLGEARRAQFSYLGVDSRTFNDDGLLSPREISNIVASQTATTQNSRGLSELFVFFGQFIDHDFALATESDTEVDIEVPEDDPTLRVNSLHFSRSDRAIVNTASTTERAVTILSSALDLSTVYGVNQNRNTFLRVPNSCRLKTSEGNNLPFNTDDLVNTPSTTASFYIAGDTRVNEHPMLTTIHTIFLREHNNICDLLEDALPDMDAESMFQAARAVNIAQYQKIIYEEWIPAIMGRRMPPYTGYKPNVDPTISIEFTTAGFRLGHTMVGNGVSRIDENGNILPLITMAEMFFRDSNLATGDIENFLRGAAQTRAQEVDLLVVDALRNFLFTNVDNVEGFDLIALNLQRSRDHNVPRFNELRRFFLGSPANSFAQISSDPAVRQKLRQAYGTVDNVEAWVGLMAENKRGDVGLGRTNEQLWMTEFTRLRDGDRFFYLDNDRHNQIPQQVLEALPQINQDVFVRRAIFRRILRRTTNIRGADVPSGNVFRT